MLIRLNNVKKQYSGFALDCSLEVPKGCVTAVIGPNGAGKSTTFKLILGLTYPDSGSVELFGKPQKDLTREDKEKLGIVLSGASYSSYLHIRDLLAVHRRLYPAFDEKRFVSKCADFQLPLDKKVKDFSTGMKAKLKLLLAMCHEARVLLLDEPTVGLDVLAREEILDMLREYMLPGDRSILISSHISSDLEGLCDDIYLVDQGKILLHEETNALLDGYGLLKVTEEQYQKMDRSRLLRRKRESYGYSLLTDRKDYYEDNAPELVMEKGSIDETIAMIIKGETI